MIYLVIGILAALVIAQGVILYLVFSRSQQTIDELTSKIMASSLDNYTINRKALPVVQPKPVKPAVQKPAEDLIPISEADPDLVMQALARGAGRYDEEFGEP